MKLSEQGNSFYSKVELPMYNYFLNYPFLGGCLPKHSCLALSLSVDLLPYEMTQGSLYSSSVSEPPFFHCAV